MGACSCCVVLGCCGGGSGLLFGGGCGSCCGSRGSGGFLCEKCHYLKEVSLNINDSLLFKKIYITKINEINEDYLKEFNDHVNINKCINKYYEWHLDFKSRVKEILEKIG